MHIKWNNARETLILTPNASKEELNTKQIKLETLNLKKKKKTNNAYLMS